MAMIIRGVSTCPLCQQILTDPIFATSHFIDDKDHPLSRYSDAAMHWDCYAKWPHQAEFAAMYFETDVAISRLAHMSQYWAVLWQSSEALVTSGLAINMVAIKVKKSGTDMRVARKAWDTWLADGWRDTCAHELETAAIAELLPQLRCLTLP